MKWKRLLVMLGCAVALVVAGVVVWYLQQPKPLYRVTFLPSLGGVETRARAINDSGRVALTARMADGTTRIVLWDKSGRTVDLGLLPPGDSVWSLAFNNVGQMAATVSDANAVATSFFWDTDGRRYRLDGPGGEQVRIRAINNRGQVVGYRHVTRTRYAFLWDVAGGMRDVGVPGNPESFACDINDRGQIVGFYATPMRHWRAFLCDPNLGMRNLGVTPYDEGTCCINNRGFVVGQFGSIQPECYVSTWTAPGRRQRIRLRGADALLICGLDEKDRYFLNGHYRGIHLLRRELGARSESHLWESGRHVRRLTGSLCAGDGLRRGDVEDVGGWDISKDGTILAMLKMKGSADWRPALLEPIE